MNFYVRAVATTMAYTAKAVQVFGQSMLLIDKLIRLFI